MLNGLKLIVGIMLGSLAIMPTALAEGIVAKVVSSPISATGTVQGAITDLNVYLQSDEAQGIDFMDPNVIGYGIPANGRVEIELTEGFKRIKNLSINEKGAQAVNGTPQQGMVARKFGYTVGEGANKNTILLTATREGGLPAEYLMSPAEGAKNDPVRQRGIKVFHIGLLHSAFINKGTRGTIEVRFIDGKGETTHTGSATIDFLPAAVPQLHPNNLPDGLRNHNWQVVKAGQVVGKEAGTVPIPVILYERIDVWGKWRSASVRFARRFGPGSVSAELGKFKKGISGVGVLSRQQLAAAKFEKPASLARYNDGLIVRDTNGDGRLDPTVDQLIGGVTISAPAGAKGYDIRSLDTHGAPDLSRPTTAYHQNIGSIIGGTICLLQFTAGDKPGIYRPTLALLSDPDDQSSPDGASYTYTIVVE